jgi:hypothetical protein
MSEPTKDELLDIWDECAELWKKEHFTGIEIDNGKTTDALVAINSILEQYFAITKEDRERAEKNVSTWRGWCKSLDAIHGCSKCVGRESCDKTDQIIRQALAKLDCAKQGGDAK